ncbi:tape measure domain-containing protein [Bradyrhizobium diazoefficiens]
MSQTFDELVVKFTADISGLKASMDGASQQVAAFRSQTNSQLGAIEASFKSLTSTARMLGVALGIKELLDVGKNALETSMRVQALQFRLIAATGSTEDAAQASQFAAEMADKYGFAVLDVEKQLASFLLATRGTTLSLNESQNAFEGVSVYAKAMGLDANNVTRGMIAFQEIMGQGTLRAQQMQMLIRDLHISYQMMADAVKEAGGSVEKLHELMKKGAIDGKEAILALTSVMRDQFGTVAQAASQTLEGNLNRLGNKWVELQTVFGQSGGMQAANVAVYGLSRLLSDLEPVAAGVAHEMQGLEILGAYLYRTWNLDAEALSHLYEDLVSVMTALKGVGTATEDLLEGNVTGAVSALKGASAGLNKELDANASASLQRSKDILAEYNNTVKAIMTPYSYPDINGKKPAPHEKEPGQDLSESKRHALEEQVRHVEEYSDDEGDKLKSQLAEHQKVLEKAYSQHVITKKKFDDDMEAIQRDFDKRMGDYVAKNFGNEIEQENQDNKDRLDALNKALANKLITQQKYDELVEKQQKDHQKKLLKAENDFNNQMRSVMRTALDGFLGMQTTYQERTLEEEGASFRDSISQAAQHNRTFFELEKAAKIAQALLSARQSVVDSYAFGASIGGPPLGVVFAGVAAAAQAANIAAIASTSFGSSGSVSGGSGGDIGTTAPSDAQGPANVSNAGGVKKTIHITVQGGYLSTGAVRDLIGQIQDAINDGTTLVTSP